MFGTDDLRPFMRTDGGESSCPVQDCATRVPVQRKTFAATEEFLCPVHRIYIGQTTFEYQNEEDNFLWNSDADRARLVAARKLKRESRMNRERSEDALSWNVFRYLEVSGLLGDWVSSVTGQHGSVAGAQVHFWSCDSSTGETWKPLADARKAFGEQDNKGSEPDLIITTGDTDIWVEAKFGWTNKTHPSDANGARDRYTSGGDGWYVKAVKSEFTSVAVERQRYELLRLWLLGSWAAEQRGKRFELVNLVREGCEEDAPAFVAEHMRPTQTRRFHRATWEGLADLIGSKPIRTADDETLLGYMRTKTLGYNSAGRLVRAFSRP